MTTAPGPDRAERDELVERFAVFPGRLADAARAAVDRPVPAGEWGPNDVVRHLIACEVDVHQARLTDLATDAAPEWGLAEPGPWSGEPGLTLAELLDRFAALRSATLITVGELDDAGWSRSGRHATLGVFDVRGLLANAVDHDEHHLAGLA